MKTITYHSLSLFVAGLLSCATAFASNNNGTPVGGKLTKFAEKHQHKRPHNAQHFPVGKEQ